MVTFFYSLQMLFPQSDKTNEMASVIDKQKLRKIKEATEKKSKMVWPEELATPLKKKVFGQDNVIDALADKIVINQMHKNDKLLVIALIGPTATGKSETAKSLAEIMSNAYGTQYGYIEIAGSEFIGEHTVHRFFGLSSWICWSWSDDHS